MPATDDPLSDFAALRRRALGRLQQLAGSHWTDHNHHDPGITLLETLCYVLTDLGYRSAWPVADLVADAPAPFTPAQVLPSGPVTPDDWRKWLTDQPGVGNSWVARADRPLAVHDAAQQLLRVLPPAPVAASGVAAETVASPNLSELRPAGLYRVWLEKAAVGDDVDGSSLVRQAALRLQRWRSLGEDVAEILVLDRQPVALDAELELAAGVDPTEALAGVHEALTRHMAPPPPWRSLDELLARGCRVDQIFEGPLLERGFLDPAEWTAGRRRDALRLSDLIQVLMAVPGVLAVTRLAFLRDGRPVGDWLLPLAADRSPAYDPGGSRLRLTRRGLRLDHEGLQAAARRRAEARARQAAGPATAERDLPAPVGRPRAAGRYASLQTHLPAAYGVGPAGLSAAEPAERLARAQQLKAYLLLFDQLLANQFAQLGRAGWLLSGQDGSPGLLAAQAVPDEGGALRLDGVRRGDADAQAARVAELVRDPWGDDPLGTRGLAGRHRLADHLLARLGEHWGDAAAPADDAAAGSADSDAALAARQQRALRDKQAFLRDYPLSAVRRAAGEDLLADPAADPAPAGLVLRLARLLGLDPLAERCTLVEHILLRPLPADGFQQGPWLRGVVQPDPFSLWLTLVLPGEGGRGADAEFRQRVAQVARAEAPAHLGLRLLWLDAAALAEFDAAHARWRALWRSALQQRWGLAPPPAGPAAERQHALRSARNRLIDLLGLGDSFPLSDLVVADGGAAGPIKVAHGRPAYIAVDASEAGVRYTLRGPDGRPLLAADGQPLAVAALEGNGERIVLETPPVTDDLRFRVLATKLRAAPGLPPQPPVLLDQGAAVKVGLDSGLAIAWDDLPLLDATTPSPQPGDARLADFGARAGVRVHQSQEGVAYTLVLDGVVQDGAVVGDLGSIVLQTPPLREDAVVAVQARKRFDDAGDDASQAEVALLDARLRVAVRADPGPALQPLPGAVLDWRQADAALRLASSQASAHYQVFARRVRDAEWLRDTADTTGLLTAGSAAPEAPAVAWPAAGPAAADGLPPGFVPLGEPLPGNGGALDLPLGAPTDDAVYLVQASKRHAPADAPAEAAVVTTRVGLRQALLLLVRPDPAPALLATLAPGAADHPPTLALTGGQPGVFYRLRRLPDGPDLPQAAYMHQRSDGDPARNKGLGQLAVGIDLVLAGPPGTAAGPELPPPDQRPPDQRPPAAPTLDLADLPADATLGLQAVKAQTGLAAAVAATLQLAAWPLVRLDPPAVAPGGSSRVRVADSLASDRYRLLRPDVPPLDAKPGNGGELLLDTGPVDHDLLLTLELTRPAQDLPLLRRLPLRLWCLPRADLALSVQPAAVAAGEAASVVVAGSEPGVVYQLLAGDDVSAAPLGAPLTGDGGDLSLPTGPLAADTRLRVLARRPLADLTPVLLDAVLTVAVTAPA